MRKAKLFMINSIVMIITSIILRMIYVSFNVYISKKIGFAGIGLVEIIMSVFGFSVIVASSGVGLAATRLVSEEIANKSHAGIRRSMRCCLIYSIFFGLCASITLYFGADFIGRYLLKDIRTIYAMKILSISLPFYSAQCALYGYFTAVRRVYLSCAVQVFEMGARIYLTIFYLEKNLAKGMEAACNGLMIAATLSEIIAFAIMYTVFKFDRRRYNKKDKSLSNIKHRLFRISIPVALSSYACSALCTIKNVLIPFCLVAYGMTRDEALSQYGIINAMVLPIILFPAAFLSVFSSLIIPELTECYRLGNNKRINYIITRAFQVTLIFTICVIGIFLKFSNEFGIVIYQNLQIGIYIKILTPLALIAYLDGMVDAMLKGLDEQVASMMFNITDSVFSIILVLFFLPRFGFEGLIFIVFASKLLNTFLSINKITVITDFKIKYVDWMLKPLICIFISVVFSKVIVNFASPGYKFSTTTLVLYCTSSIIIYAVLIILNNCVSKDDIRLFFKRFKSS